MRFKFNSISELNFNLVQINFNLIRNSLNLIQINLNPNGLNLLIGSKILPTNFSRLSIISTTMTSSNPHLHHHPFSIPFLLSSFSPINCSFPSTERKKIKNQRVKNFFLSFFPSWPFKRFFFLISRGKRKKEWEK